MDPENQHEHTVTREVTSFSLTDTLVNRPQGDRHPSLLSVFSGPASTITSTCPQQSPDDLTQLRCERSTLDDRFVSIPPVGPTRKRTLVLCFDGTGEHFNANNSNIVKFVSLLKKEDNSQQMVYYQAGIGTYKTTPIVGRISSLIWRLLDLMFALDVNDHVIGGYEFLMQTYVPGDNICLFGFSRGAHTARSLAGMIQKVGLLPSYNVQQVPFAYKMYTQCDNFGWDQSNAFKKAFSHDVDNIQFIGVWDTVDSVGIYPKRLPFASSPTIIHTFRHALALDERRANFKVTPWNRPNTKEEKLGIKQYPARPQAKVKALDEKDKQHFSEEQHEEVLGLHEQLHTKTKKKDTDVKEVWFAGCHCDVGGGSVKNSERNSLARIPLRWMIRECFKAESGIIFDTQGLRELGLDPSRLFPRVLQRPDPRPVRDAAIQTFPARVYKDTPKPPSLIHRWFSRFKKQQQLHSFPHIGSALIDHTKVEETKVEEPKVEEIPIGSEEEEDLKDALSPIYSALKLHPGYWFLEFLPLKVRYQQGDKHWVESVIFNRGRARWITGQHDNDGRRLRIHRSVKTRMDACYPLRAKKYLPSPDIRVEPHWEDLDPDDDVEPFI